MKLRRGASLLFIACLHLPFPALCASLEYSVVGLKDELERNALAWLGDPPESAQQRISFVASAREKVERSLQALGYYSPDISVDIQRGEPVWKMRIEVDPGEPVRIRDVTVQLLGPAAADSGFDGLLSSVPFRPGDVLRHDTYEAYKKLLLATGQRRGYFDGKVVHSRVAVETGARSADVELRYESGRRYRFGELRYDQSQISSAQIDALRTFATGDYFAQEHLQQLQAQLLRTGFYSGVLLTPELQQAEDGLIPLTLTLYPAKRHSFDVGIGYSTDTEERVSLTWRTPKINRFGHSQETRLEYSPINPSGRITYNIPLTHPINDFLQFSARLEDNEFGDIDSQQEELGVRRETRGRRWITGYSLRSLSESWELLQDSRTNDYLLPGFSLSRRDRVGSLVDPSRAFSQFYQFEAGSASAGSDIDLLRATARFGYIFSLAPDHRLVSRAELGLALVDDSDRGDLAPSLNFFAGGAQSIRGYGYQSVGNEVQVTREGGDTATLVVGGDRMVTASIEYQYYFNRTWRGALFLDGGDAFDEGEFDLHLGAGFGVHYLTPVGAVRLEFANPFSEDKPDWRIHLAIGAEF
jgi:translocation and assembly module TamA